MEEKVLNTINKYHLIKSGDKIVLAVSGGPDSLFMLYILNKIKNDINIALNFDIVVCHINHMIREEANAEEEFVKNFCKKINVECYTKRIDVINYANNKKIGTEEAGRIVRYDFFEKIMKSTGANKIAVAHNKNDKVETMIMNLLRGSGISGLRGIEPIRDEKYIRPIIEIDRKDIEKYCEENDLNPRIDKSNFENIYTRNKVRNIVIPYIKENFNPNIIQTMTRLSDILTEEDDFLNELTKQKYLNLLIDSNNEEIILDLKKFNKEEKVIKKRLIIYTVTRLCGSSKGLEKIHIDDIIKLCENNIGNKFLTPNKNLKILIKDKKIFFKVQKTIIQPSVKGKAMKVFVTKKTHKKVLKNKNLYAILLINFKDAYVVVNKYIQSESLYFV